MLGYFEIGLMPLGTAEDDGEHGQINESAVELDASSADLRWLIEIDCVDLTTEAA